MQSTSILPCPMSHQFARKCACMSCMIVQTCKIEEALRMGDCETKFITACTRKDALLEADKRGALSTTQLLVPMIHVKEE